MFETLIQFNFLIVFVFFIFIVIYFYNKLKNKHKTECLAKIPGPEPKYPFIGNIDLFRIKGIPLNECMFRVCKDLSEVYEKYGIFKFRLGFKPIVVVFKQNTIESLLTSNINITKADQYGFVMDWLGKGLLTSTGPLWKSRRRLLTPAFHFKILEDFIPVMNNQTDILISKLKTRTEKAFIDIREYITECTLDIICETAMGISIGAQVGNNKEYTNAIHNTGETIMKRIVTPWLWPNFIFFATKMGKEYKKSLNIMHSMTRRVIKERKEEIIANKDSNNDKEFEITNETNIYLNKSRKRLAFLDLLLKHNIEDNSLSLEDIREEVDTFMFEGHDTTSVSLSWTLYLLGLHPDIQIRIQEELESIFGDQTDRDITPEDLKQMNYLECVIKESLRLYPSVPFIGRITSEDLQCGDYLIPKGTDIFLFIERVHFDPQVFEEPMDFKPQRFESNNTSNLNAYSYVPFSAGPRSCIGKRFALTEEKIILAKIFLNFNLKSLDARHEIITSSEMVYRSKSPLRIQIISKEKFNN